MARILSVAEGDIFSRLKIVKILKMQNGKRWVSAICECGTIKNYKLDRIKSGNTKSCGCYRLECLSKKGKNKTNKKNYTLSYKSLYSRYAGMKQRCYNKKAKAYKNYGGRGIIVCDDWLGKNGFINFYNWSMENGYSDDLTIDRIDNDKGYSPDNCRWATRIIQANNKRNNKFYTYEGQTLTISEWARRFNVSVLKMNRLLKKYTIDISVKKLKQKRG